MPVTREDLRIRGRSEKTCWRLARRVHTWLSLDVSPFAPAARLPHAPFCANVRPPRASRSCRAYVEDVIMQREVVSKGRLLQFGCLVRSSIMILDL